jgi:hypothetical protein
MSPSRPNPSWRVDPMRPFGHAVDLDLDFGQPDRPGLVTTILAHCNEPGDAAFWWSQPVSVRTVTLLRLVALTEHRDEISLSARCGAGGCGESFEFTLPLLSLAGGAADDSPLHVQLDDERTLTMRRPVGEDLRRWRDARPVSRAAMLRVMLDSLVLAGRVGPEDEAGVSASISVMDPLVDFAVSCQCPACGAPNEVALDLEVLALERLANRQSALLQEVHRFALSYGWTESEVLAVPPSRRARYLTLIEERR